MIQLYAVRCYINGQVVRSEICTSLMEADVKAKEFINMEFYEQVKIEECKNA